MLTRTAILKEMFHHEDLDYYQRFVQGHYNEQLLLEGQRKLLPKLFRLLKETFPHVADHDLKKALTKSSDAFSPQLVWKRIETAPPKVKIKLKEMGPKQFTRLALAYAINWTFKHVVLHHLAMQANPALKIAQSSLTAAKVVPVAYLSYLNWIDSPYSVEVFAKEDIKDNEDIDLELTNEDVKRLEPKLRKKAKRCFRAIRDTRHLTNLAHKIAEKAGDKDSTQALHDQFVELLAAQANLVKAVDKVKEDTAEKFEHALDRVIKDVEDIRAQLIMQIEEVAESEPVTKKGMFDLGDGIYAAVEPLEVTAVDRAEWKRITRRWKPKGKGGTKKWLQCTPPERSVTKRKRKVIWLSTCYYKKGDGKIRAMRRMVGGSKTKKPTKIVIDGKTVPIKKGRPMGMEDDEKQKRDDRIKAVEQVGVPSGGPGAKKSKQPGAQRGTFAVQESGRSLSNAVGAKPTTPEQVEDHVDIDEELATVSPGAYEQIDPLLARDLKEKM
jgi:hypothetical protein